MQKLHSIFITGTNRGLGKELVKVLSAEHPQSQLHLTSRLPPQEFNEFWQKEIPHNSFHFYQLDANSPASIQQNVELLKKNKVQLDVIVANAAVGCDYGTQLPSEELASSTLRTNVSATIDYINAFLPFLSNSGRIVIVSSKMGALSDQSKPIQELLQNPNITEQEIKNIVEDYIQCTKEKKMKDYSWSAYKTSKALINAYGRFILSKKLKPNQSLVCMHPGWCQTDMGGKNALKTAEEGARLINNCIWLQKVDYNFFYNEKPCSYVPCE